MLGWEFPPLINGGLGIATFGMAKALAKHVNLTVILPKSDPDFIVENVELIGLNNTHVKDIKKEIRTYYNTTIEKIKKEYESFSDIHEIEINLLPYGETYKSSTKKTTKSIEEEIIPVKVQRKVEVSKSVGEEDLGYFKIDKIYGDEANQKVIEYAKFVGAIAAQKDIDIIHGHDWMTVLSGIEARRRTDKPFVFHAHALTYDRGGPDSRGFIYDLEKHGMDEADAIIPVSYYTGDIVRDHYQIDAKKIFPVHNGADPVEVYKKAKTFPEKLVLFLGRVTGQKNPEVFLEVAAKVLENYPNVRFVIAGSGDRLREIIESGAYKKVGNKFHFTGFLDRSKVNDLLAMSNVYCMPSVSEPFGLSALEAAQFGIPAVISKQSGAAEVLNSALKADHWDVDLMAKQIIKLLEDEALCKQIVKESFIDIENLTWDKSAREIVEVYHKTIEQYSKKKV